MEQEIKQAMIDAGITPPSSIQVDGEIHRFKTPDDKGGATSGWYIFHADGTPAGKFGDWRIGEQHNWSRRGVTLTRPQIAHLDKKIKAEQEKRAARRAEAVKQAALILAQAKPADDHQYIKNKGIKPNGVGQVGNELIVPYYIGDELSTIQKIQPNGFKMFLTDCKAAGAYHTIGNLANARSAIVAEGYSTGASVHEATGLPVIVAGNANNITPVCENIKSLYPSLKLNYAADHDKSGIGEEKARKAAEQYGGTVWLPPELGDWNDYHQRHGLDAVKQSYSQNVKHDTTSRRFRAVKLSTIPRKKTEWLIHGYIEANSLSLLFGDPGSGKSFIAIDWGLHVANGMDWQGQKTKAGSVFYICGEGERGIPKRADAWQAYYQGDPDSPFYISTTPAAMIDPENLNAVSEAIQEDIDDAPKLIIIDTLSRNIGGDENSSLDMPAFIAACDRLRFETGAAVLVVHHTGHGNKDRARGYSGLPGALDFQYRCDKDENDITRLENTKTKDGKPPEPKAFAQKIVELEIEDTTETSLVLIETEYEPKQKANKKGQQLGKNQKKAIEILASLTNKARFKHEQQGRDPNTARVTRDAWERAILLDIPAKSSRQGLIDGLLERGEAFCELGFVYPKDHDYKPQ